MSAARNGSAGYVAASPEALQAAAWGVVAASDCLRIVWDKHEAADDRGPLEFMVEVMQEKSQHLYGMLTDGVRT